jgi:hypothetical protein
LKDELERFVTKNQCIRFMLIWQLPVEFGRDNAKDTMRTALKDDIVYG